jgi:hypothetical protein
MFFILYNGYVSMNMIDWCLTPTLTVVCGSFWCVDKIQNGGCWHGNQGAIFF